MSGTNDVLDTQIVRMTPEQLAEREAGKKNKLPAKDVLRYCKKLRTIYLTYKLSESLDDDEEIRHDILQKHSDIALLSRKCPFMFYTFTCHETADDKFDVYYYMMKMQIKIDSGQIGEKEGQLLIGKRVFRYADDHP